LENGKNSGKPSSLYQGHSLEGLSRLKISSSEHSVVVVIWNNGWEFIMEGRSCVCVACSYPPATISISALDVPNYYLPQSETSLFGPAFSLYSKI
jgi:hypothetical protein